MGKHDHRITPLQGALRICREAEETLLDDWSEKLIREMRDTFNYRVLNDDFTATIAEIKKIVFPRVSLILEALEQSLPFPQVNEAAHNQMKVLSRLCEEVSKLFITRENTTLSYQDALKAKSLIDQRVWEGKKEIEELLELMKDDQEKEVEEISLKMEDIQRVDGETQHLSELVQKQTELFQNFLKKVLRLKEKAIRNITEELEKKILENIVLMEEVKNGLNAMSKRINGDLFQLQIRLSRCQSLVQAIDRIIDLWRKPSLELPPPTVSWVTETQWLQQVKKKINKLSQLEDFQTEFKKIEEAIQNQSRQNETLQPLREFTLADKALAVLVTYGVTESRGRRPSTIMDACLEVGLITREDVGRLKDAIDESTKGTRALFTEVLIQGPGGFVGKNLQPSPFGRIIAPQIVAAIITPEIKEKIRKIKREKDKKFSERRAKKR